MSIGGELVQEILAFGKINGAAIVGVGKIQVPEVAALIEVGQAWRSYFEKNLHERIANAQFGDALLKREEIIEEGFGAIRIESVADELGNRAFILRVGGDPVRMDASFADGFDHGHLKPFGVLSDAVWVEDAREC